VIIITKKGSLNLSINAIVIFILALTLLGLGIPFITGVFKKADDLTSGRFDRILAEEEKAFMEGCSDDFCIDQTRFVMKRNEEVRTLMVLNNKFDCDIDEAIITIGGEQGGSSNFEPGSCNIIGGENAEQKCSDVSITTVDSESILSKEKTPVDIKIRVQNTAKNTVYSYKINVKGSCVFDSQEFEFDSTETLRVDVQG